MTYRDRREARAERLNDWADKREAKAEAAFERVDAIAGMIPFGQPILVGHSSERRARADADRIDRGMHSSLEHANKATEMRRKAVNITAAAEGAIYSDDPDARERLQEKLDGLLAERAAIVAYNKTARKGAPDLSLLTPSLRGRLLGGSGVDNQSGALPAYVLSNLSGVIANTRRRLDGLR